MPEYGGDVIFTPTPTGIGTYDYGQFDVSKFDDPGSWGITVNGVNYADNVTRGTIKGKLNELTELSIEMVDVSAADYAANLRENKEVILYWNSANGYRCFFGRVASIDKKTDGECTLACYDRGIVLNDYTIVATASADTNYPTDRPYYNGVSSYTLFNELIDAYNAAFPGNPLTKGIIDDQGLVYVRYDQTTLLKAVASFARTTGTYWWVDKDPSGNDRINLCGVRGGVESAPTYTFNVSGDDQNIQETVNSTDSSAVVNNVTVLGYGDGVNQISANCYAASTTYTTLYAEISDSVTTIRLLDATNFAASGTINICGEQITYTGKTGNQLTGCTRGANSTTALKHLRGAFVSKQVAIASYEAGSSIDSYGRKDQSYDAKDVIDKAYLELLASTTLLENMLPPKRIQVHLFQPGLWASLEMGSYLTVNDSDAGLAEAYQYVGFTIDLDPYDSNNDGELETAWLELGDFTNEASEILQKQQSDNEKVSHYMQGATNNYAVPVYENTDASHPLDLRIYIPPEAIAINKVKLNFKLKDYRAYQTDASAINSNPTVPGSAYGSVNTVTLADNGTWYDCDTYATPSADLMGVWVNINTKKSGEPPVSAAGSDNARYRIYDGTNYWPSSSGISIASATRAVKESGGATTGITTAYASNVIFVPGNVRDKTLTVQACPVDSASYAISIWSNFFAESAHTHNVDYGINTSTNTGKTITLAIGPDDGSAPSVVASGLSDQNNYDITSQVVAVVTPGVGGWVLIRFTPNKIMRIEANAYVQVFVQSR